MKILSLLKVSHIFLCLLIFFENSIYANGKTNEFKGRILTHAEIESIFSKHLGFTIPKAKFLREYAGTVWINSPERWSYSFTYIGMPHQVAHDDTEDICMYLEGTSGFDLSKKNNDETVQQPRWRTTLNTALINDLPCDQIKRFTIILASKWGFTFGINQQYIVKALRFLEGWTAELKSAGNDALCEGLQTDQQKACVLLKKDLQDGSHAEPEYFTMPQAYIEDGHRDYVIKFDMIGLYGRRYHLIFRINDDKSFSLLSLKQSILHL